MSDDAHPDAARVLAALTDKPTPAAPSAEDVAKMLDGVTPGPWSVCIDDDGNPLSGRPSVQAADEYDCAIIHWDGFVQEYWRSARGDKEIHANARFIAWARTAVPALSAERDALEAVLSAGSFYKEEDADWLVRRAEAAEARVAELEVENADLRLNMDADLQTMCRERDALTAANATIAAQAAEMVRLRKRDDMMSHALRLDPWSVGWTTWRMFAAAVIDTALTPPEGDTP